jgi:hypothetical protein
MQMCNAFTALHQSGKTGATRYKELPVRNCKWQDVGNPISHLQ